MGIGNGETGLSMCNSGVHRRDEHKCFSSLLLSSHKAHRVQDNSKHCCFSICLPGFYFLLKRHFIRMMQLSTLGRRKGRNVDLLSVKFLHTWHRPYH